MQSGAFLQLILTLVAVVSRIRMACEVLQDILRSILDVTRHILGLSPVTRPSILPEDPILSLPGVEVSQGDAMNIDPIYKNSSTSKLVDSEIDVSNSEINVPARTFIKRNVSSSATLESEKDRGHKMKKKAKKAKDEIDDIFGF
ncbi:hypothetical protein C0995_001970 [Termitomyces sp. Mi166|nr:hypothetical protein C0995_001970 [Termitomyces sp. Mi166\